MWASLEKTMKPKLPPLGWRIRRLSDGNWLVTSRGYGEAVEGTYAEAVKHAGDKQREWDELDGR